LIFLDRKNFRIHPEEEPELLKMVLQNVYGTFPNVEGINFMLKGDVTEELNAVPEMVKPLLSMFVECPLKNASVLKV
jgi:hypothetical protein